MKINQFSITPTSLHQRQAELARIRLLKDGECEAMDAKALLETCWFAPTFPAPRR